MPNKWMCMIQLVAFPIQNLKDLGRVGHLTCRLRRIIVFKPSHPNILTIYCGHLYCCYSVSLCPVVGLLQRFTLHPQWAFK